MFFTQILALQAGENPKTEIDSPKQNAIAMARKLCTDFLFSFVQFLQVQNQTKHPTKNRNKNIKKQHFTIFEVVSCNTSSGIRIPYPYRILTQPQLTTSTHPQPNRPFQLTDLPPGLTKLESQRNKFRFLRFGWLVMFLGCFWG